MSIDISNEPDTIAWKAHYLALGLPESLLDEMIAEANAEYNSTIGYVDLKRLAMLTVNLEDHNTTANCYYVYCIVFDLNIIQGFDTTAITRIFAQVPCVNLTVQVFKVTNDNKTCVAYGETYFVHTKDEEITVVLDSTNPLANLTFEVLDNDSELTKTQVKFVVVDAV